MSDENPDLERKIQLASWWPVHIADQMVPVKAILPATVLCDDTTSSLGPALDRLPLEILHCIFSLLDFRSLSRLSQVSRQGKRAVEMLPAYRDVKRHASKALDALNRTGLLSQHPAILVYDTLRTEACVYCQNFSPFLFLISCERCCYNCLSFNPALRLLTVRVAKIYFGLSRKDASQLSVLLSLPGSYRVGYAHERKKPHKLVSLRQAKELAVSLYGWKNMTAALSQARDRHALSEDDRWFADWFLQRITKPWAEYPDTKCDIPADFFNGMGSVYFPFLHRDGTLEKGLWCYGCKRNSEMYYSTREYGGDMGGLDPSTTSGYYFMRMLECRARTKSDFLAHIRECRGAKRLLSAATG
ncbi:hypothetical protein PRK78_004436 [Emydomyces testavorans]|uniref:F-box domain-containing protein n=1 Tax=Emydomyces testavorans TaxID=2070801 RepID=A0AAF0DIK1_9EURO|nr:hypothetical protein PRK78_004436 [Emydomyces testavorans]